VSLFKIASFEANDPILLDAHAAQPVAKQVIVSMGMGARQSLIKQHLRLHDVRYLHCVSAYPTPVEDLHLAQIGALGRDGFSDHSAPEQTWTGGLAVAAGATIIERHLRADDTPSCNPDFGHIRFAEQCLGTVDVHANPSEAPMRPYRVL
jgi:sialic acid synthase SpsE